MKCDCVFCSCVVVVVAHLFLAGFNVYMLCTLLFCVWYEALRDSAYFFCCFHTATIKYAIIAYFLRLSCSLDNVSGNYLTLSRFECFEWVMRACTMHSQRSRAMKYLRAETHISVLLSISRDSIIIYFSSSFRWFCAFIAPKSFRVSFVWVVMHVAAKRVSGE